MLVVFFPDPHRDASVEFMASMRHHTARNLSPRRNRLAVSFQMFYVHEEKRNVASSEIPKTNQIIEIGHIA